MRVLFINENDQLRSGWRALSFLLFFMLSAAILASLTTTIFVATPLAEHYSKSVAYSVNFVVLLGLALGLGFLAGKLFENLPYSELGAAFTGSWFRNLLTGLLIGAATLSFAVLVSALFGGQSFIVNSSNGWGAVVYSLLTTFAFFGIQTAWEEAFFRGYILQTLARSGLAWLAITLTSVFFGLVHLGNDNASLISTVNTILAGVWFSLAYLKTRDLWFVWGLHFAWNWTQGSIFGIEVSGITEFSSIPLLKEIDQGPAWLTGADYGIEGGVACTVALVISSVAIRFLPGTQAPSPANAGSSGVTGD